MSEAEPVLEELDGIDEAENTTEVGTPSEESSSVSRSSRAGMLSSLTIYDAMLIASALSISVAVVLMALELTSFGGLFYQWRTSEAEVNAITLP